jgi:hypothetical protein
MWSRLQSPLLQAGEGTEQLRFIGEYRQKHAIPPANLLTLEKYPRQYYFCANVADQPQFDSLISRPELAWIGRAFIGYSRPKIAICSADTCTGSFSTIHSTSSLHGGVVSDPM